MITLKYIWHDCFVYEDDRAVIVFDYWKDPTIVKNEIPIFIRNAGNKRKRLYVVVSHHHKDHYVKDIFNWCEICPDIRYILSKDTARFARHMLRQESLYTGIKPDPATVTVLGPGDSFHDENVSFEAFGSTDVGNSYSVESGDITIFHSGDLNAWIWKDESTKKEVEAEINRFERILEQIFHHRSHFDIAMFPVDSRIGTAYYTGAKLFLNKFDVSHFFPMHFGLGTQEEQVKYQLDAAAVELYANPGRGECICLQSPYACFEMSDTP